MVVPHRWELPAESWRAAMLVARSIDGRPPTARGCATVPGFEIERPTAGCLATGLLRTLSGRLSLWSSEQVRSSQEYLLQPTGCLEQNNLPHLRPIVEYCRNDKDFLAVLDGRVKRLTTLLVEHSPRSVRAAAKKQADFVKARRESGFLWVATFNGTLSQAVKRAPDPAVRSAMANAGRLTADEVWEDFNNLAWHCERALHTWWRRGLAEGDDAASIVVAAAAGGGGGGVGGGANGGEDEATAGANVNAMVLATVYYLAGWLLSKLRVMAERRSTEDPIFMTFRTKHSIGREAAVAAGLPTGVIDGRTRGRLLYPSKEFFDFVVVVERTYAVNLNLEQLTRHSTRLLLEIHHALVASTVANTMMASISATLCEQAGQGGWSATRFGVSRRRLLCMVLRWYTRMRGKDAVKSFLTSLKDTSSSTCLTLRQSLAALSRPRTSTAMAAARMEDVEEEGDGEGKEGGDAESKTEGPAELPLEPAVHAALGEEDPDLDEPPPVEEALQMAED